jgi:hypothetical protein
VFVLCTTNRFKLKKDVHVVVIVPKQNSKGFFPGPEKKVQT